MTLKLSPAQRYQVDKLNGKTLMTADYCNRFKCWLHTPYERETRTFDALEAKGVVRRVTVDEGYSYNGYVLTELGKSL